MRLRRRVLGYKLNKISKLQERTNRSNKMEIDDLLHKIKKE